MSLLGCRLFSDSRFIFYQSSDSEKVTADVLHEGEEIKNLDVDISNLTFPYSLADGSTVQKVKWLVQNCHFNPTIKESGPEQKKEVNFELISPEQKKWEPYRKLDLDIRKIKIINSETLFFETVLNSHKTITLWNWKLNCTYIYHLAKDEEMPQVFFLSHDKVILFEPKKKLVLWNALTQRVENLIRESVSTIEFFLALPEVLIFGHEEGKIEIRKASGTRTEFQLPAAIKDPTSSEAQFVLKGLIALDENRLVAICSKGGSHFAVFTDLRSSQPIFSLIETAGSFKNPTAEVISDDRFVFREGGNVLFGSWEQKGFVNLPKDFAKAINSRYCLLSSLSKKRKIEEMEADELLRDYYLFDLKETKEVKLGVPEESQLRYMFTNDYFVKAYQDVLYIGYQRDSERDVYKFNIKDGSLLKKVGYAHRGYQFFCFEVLEDGYLVSGASDHVAKIYSPANSREPIYERSGFRWDVSAILLLENGYVLIKGGSVEIIRPCNKEPKEALTSCKKTAKLYQEQKEEAKEYHTYLLGFSQALEEGLFSQARKFFAKACKLRSDSEEPCLLYLNAAIDRKERNYALQRLILFHKKKGNNELVEKYKNQLSHLKLRKRLFVGENDFSYTEAFQNKHKNIHANLGSFITATELDLGAYDRNKDRIEKLRLNGSIITFGVDATKLHERYKGKRFERIQWNGPYGASSNTSEIEKLGKVIAAFFLSASCVQIAGDRVHMALDQNPDKETNKYYILRQIKQFQIVPNATNAGYRLIGKRSFGEGRYLGYMHTKSGTNDPLLMFPMEEFIFEKVETIELEEKRKSNADIQSLAVAFKDPQKKEYEIKESSEHNGFYYECSTDEDSSSCETDED